MTRVQKVTRVVRMLVCARARMHVRYECAVRVPLMNLMKRIVPTLLGRSRNGLPVPDSPSMGPSMWELV